MATPRTTGAGTATILLLLCRLLVLTAIAAPT
jgi:hypothetical protein